MEQDDSVFLQWETSLAVSKGFLFPNNAKTLEIIIAATEHDELQPNTELLDLTKRMVVHHATILPEILYEMCGYKSLENVTSQSELLKHGNRPIECSNTSTGI
mmetsp:Transcript_20518/g.50339  ORF Transcript_20518/g.50339 Transcript_20518/m.50339 type:complete len:103 (+) Transcript_20518:288-596(+)